MPTLGSASISATVQDPSGQIFANGLWQLIFKELPSSPGPFLGFTSADSTLTPFTRLFSGQLDATGSFSGVTVHRNDFINPAGSRWTLIVAPNANGQSYSVDLNINNTVVDVSAAINAAITNIIVQATTVAHAYKDAEVIPIPGSGGLYFDVTNKVLKLWDIVGQVWLTVPVGISQLPITKAAIASNWLRSYDAVTGLFTASQPVYGDISGTPQLPITLGATASNWLRSYDSSTGLFTKSQPASADISDGTGTGVVARTTNPTLSAPVINGTPTGTGVPTVTLKTGTGAGNYTTSSTTFVRPDSTNLAFAVTIPVGWKLLISASGSISSATAAGGVNVALADGTADNTGILIQAILQPNTAGAATFIEFSLNWIVNGDGALHTINLQFDTGNAADAATIVNNTSTLKPMMTFLLTPSN